MWLARELPFQLSVILPFPRGFELVLVLVLAPRVFLRVLRLSSLHKSQHFQIPIRPGRQVFTHEPLAREIRRLLPTL